MSLQIFTNPSHGLAQVWFSKRISCKTRLSRVLATPPSSTLLHMDENNNNLPKSIKGFDSRGSLNNLHADSMLRQANTVGIIGGISTDSTLNFVRKLEDWSLKDGKSSLPFVLCSDPKLNKELLLYEENSYPSLYHRVKRTPADQSQIVENLRNKRRSLERCGAKLILMPCHIAHTWYDEVCEGSSVPMLHMGDCIVKELEEAKMKPLEAGNPLRVGVMASSATLSAGFYQERLQNNGFEAVLPDKATMDHTVIPAIEAMKRDDMEGARNLLRIALQVLLVQAVNVVVLGSDEMRDLLPGDDPLLKKCVDPMDALARSAIKWSESL